MTSEQIAILGFRGEYRLAVYGAVIGGESYHGFDVLCLGDEVCEQLGAERDSSGYVFPSPDAAMVARSRVINEVVRFRRGQ